MDYATVANVQRHADWDAFSGGKTGRLVLLTAKGSQSLFDAHIEPGDTLLMGSESTGVPDAIHAAADLRVRIPMEEGFRSLNVAVAAGIALAEALRQTGQLPKDV